VASVPRTRTGWIDVDGVEVFYREAGPASAPVVVLLHGLPSSSFMFRDLIPRLADRFRVIAPDYPGFGFTSRPDRWTSTSATPIPTPPPLPPPKTCQLLDAGHIKREAIDHDSVEDDLVWTRLFVMAIDTVLY